MILVLGDELDFVTVMILCLLDQIVPALIPPNLVHTHRELVKSMGLNGLKVAFLLFIDRVRVLLELLLDRGFMTVP